MFPNSAVGRSQSTKRKPAPVWPDPRPSHVRASNASLDAFWQTRSPMRDAIHEERERAYSGRDGEDVRMAEVMRRTAEALEHGDLELGMLIEARKKAEERRAREAAEKEWKDRRAAEAEKQGKARVKAVEKWRKDVPNGQHVDGNNSKAS